MNLVLQKDQGSAVLVEKNIGKNIMKNTETSKLKGLFDTPEKMPTAATSGEESMRSQRMKKPEKSVELSSVKLGTKNNTEKTGEQASSLQTPEKKSSTTQNTLLQTQNDNAVSKEETQDTTGPSMLDIRKEIWTLQKKLRAGSVDPKEANKQLRALSMMLQTVKLEVQAMEKLDPKPQKTKTIRYEDL